MFVLCFCKMFVLDLQSIDFQRFTKFIGGRGVNSTKFLCGANTYFEKRKNKNFKNRKI